jgi:hypothetical protein
MALLNPAFGHNDALRDCAGRIAMLINWVSGRLTGKLQLPRRTTLVALLLNPV